jgi:hypothetical protein
VIKATPIFKRTLYGAGERTGIMNVEGKLSKVLGKDTGTLVVKAADRDTVLDQISARMARYEKLDPELYLELKQLRQNVKDVFNKGLQPGDDILDQLYFLDPKTRDLVEKLSGTYDRIATPDDFKEIASIMSFHLREQVPILKDFTRYFGRLAESYLENAKPGSAAFDWKSIAKTKLVGSRRKGYVLPERISELLGTKANESLSEKFLKRFDFWNDNETLQEIVGGVESPTTRRTGAKFFKMEVRVPTIDIKNAAVLKDVKLTELEIFTANKLPKSWTNVPWVNFDGKIVEQNFTQSFEERLRYKTKDGEWITNILQVPQKTSTSLADELANKSGKINDIADVTKARTAYAVNGNHSNDATLVKNFHIWGADNGIETGTIHDAFFANAADMLKAREALKKIYANVINENVVKRTLDEMLARGMPKAVYDEYLDEAIRIGIIPVPGVSVVGGKVLKLEDILKPEDILRELPKGFKSDLSWYGVG